MCSPGRGLPGPSVAFCGPPATRPRARSSRYMSGWRRSRAAHHAAVFVDHVGAVDALWRDTQITVCFEARSGAVTPEVVRCLEACMAQNLKLNFVGRPAKGKRVTDSCFRKAHGSETGVLGDFLEFGMVPLGKGDGTAAQDRESAHGLYQSGGDGWLSGVGDEGQPERAGIDDRGETLTKTSLVLHNLFAPLLGGLKRRIMANHFAVCVSATSQSRDAACKGA